MHPVIQQSVLLFICPSCLSISDSVCLFFLGLIVRTHTGLSDQVPLQSLTGPSSPLWEKDKPQELPATASTWNLDIVVDIVKELVSFLLKHWWAWDWSIACLFLSGPSLELAGSDGQSWSSSVCGEGSWGAEGYYEDVQEGYECQSFGALVQGVSWVFGVR